MLIKEERHGDYNTLVLDGRLDADGSGILENSISKVMPIVRELVLDFKNVEYVSSMGLRVILQSYKQAKKYNKKIRIVNIPESVRKVFQISGFVQVFLRDEKFVMIQTEKSDESMTFELTGILEHSKDMEEVVKKCLDGHHPEKLTFDCKNLISISELACCSMITLSYKFTADGIKFIIINLPEEIVKAFKIYGYGDFIASYV